MATCIQGDREATATNTNRSLFLNDIEMAIGTAHVVSETAEVLSRSADPVFTTTPPFALLYPESAEEVAEIISAAKRYGISVWPYSTGKNWGYCNTTNADNSVVVVLTRMNRILHVDFELAYAEIEPGVTYEQLNSYLQSNNIKLWTDCTGGPPSGSVVGNALDRGIGVTPAGDHYANLCGLEVVLPNGEKICTGGFPEHRHGAWHTYKWGVGPSLEGLFVQSNFGIVTKAGIWLMREPQDFVVGAVRIAESRCLAPAIDAVREMMFAGVIPEKARFSNDVAMLTLATQAIDEGLDGQPLTGEIRESLRKKYGIPCWTGSFGIYGSHKHVRMMRNEAKKCLRPIGKLTFAGETGAKLAKSIYEWANRSSGIIARLKRFVAELLVRTSLPVLRLVPDLVDIHKGVPNESVVRRAYFRYRKQRPGQNIDVARDGIGVLWFVPLLPNRGNEIAEYLVSCEKRFEAVGIDFYVTIMILNARTAVPLMVILHDRNDEQSCERAKALYDGLYSDALDRGYQQFRCAQPGWSQLFSASPKLKDVYGALKDALDPEHVIAPGRYGIS
jgi:4-cresol dehydrogenase (hydroxylating) flavoprotein subunit